MRRRKIRRYSAGVPVDFVSQTKFARLHSSRFIHRTRSKRTAKKTLQTKNTDVYKIFIALEIATAVFFLLSLLWNYVIVFEQRDFFRLANSIEIQQGAEIFI